MNDTEVQRLIRELAKLPKETEWVEFKRNKAEHMEIGANLSALSNVAALLGKPRGYIIWGIDDKTHDIVGTTFQPHQAKKGNEELENWLLRLLNPTIDFRIYEVDIEGRRVVMFEVPPATNRPIRFHGTEYIRVGSYTKNLRDFPEKERALWRVFDQVPFEKGVAKSGVTSDEVLLLINYPKYFNMMNQPLPDNRESILKRMASEGIIFPEIGDHYSISNVGAILFAPNLEPFERLARKALRVIIYKGNNRVETIKEQRGGKGYAVGFEGAISYINDQLP